MNEVKRRRGRPRIDNPKNPRGRNITLRRKLMSDENFIHECAWCKSTTWWDQPIPLEMDHIDGNCSNNDLLNIRFLCPNCHALTPTFRYKNRKV